jgi:hypothetical protein
MFTKFIYFTTKVVQLENIIGKLHYFYVVLKNKLKYNTVLLSQEFKLNFSMF